TALARSSRAMTSNGVLIGKWSGPPRGALVDRRSFLATDAGAGAALVVSWPVRPMPLSRRLRQSRATDPGRFRRTELRVRGPITSRHGAARKLGHGRRLDHGLHGQDRAMLEVVKSGDKIKFDADQANGQFP